MLFNFDVFFLDEKCFHVGSKVLHKSSMTSLSIKALTDALGRLGF